MMDKLKIPVCIFALVMVGMFAVFLVHLPVRTGTPQIFRLRYYACQDSIGGGPLSSSIADFDWRKAFIWRASDTEYRQRQFSQFFEVLTPRIYAHLYYRFGPFMWLPLCLLMVFVIGFMIAFLVRQWTGNWLPGLVAGSFWLMTSEVLVGHHAPIRYAKDFATLEILGLISLFLALRRTGRRRLIWIVVSIGIIWWLGLFTDEYILFSLPVFIAALLSWPWLKKVRWLVIVMLLVLTGVSLWLFFFILPDVFSADIKPSLMGKMLNGMPGLSSLIERNFQYLLLNTQDIFIYTFGVFHHCYLLQKVWGALAGVMMVIIIVRTRAWRGTGKMICFWGLTTLAAGGVLLPQGNDILHQITYYNRPLIVLLLVVLGLFTDNIFKFRSHWYALVWLAILAIAALFNFTSISRGIRYDPEEAYLTRFGLPNILQLHDRLKSGELKHPVFVSYPRSRDIQSGVYEELEDKVTFTGDEGFLWSLYRSVMPRLYLRNFEEGELRADPRQFVRWVETDEHEYRSRAAFFYDMPAGIAWDLEGIRKTSLPLPSDVLWVADDGRKTVGGLADDLLGETKFTRLEAGKWCIEFPVPAAVKSPELVFALRSDRPVICKIRNSAWPGERRCSYRWSWQLLTARVRPEAAEIALCLRSEGETEVIGPLLVPARTVVRRPLSSRDYILPAGVPSLEIRGID